MCSTKIFRSAMFCLFKVWSMLHNGSAGLLQNEDSNSLVPNRHLHANKFFKTFRARTFLFNPHPLLPRLLNFERNLHPPQVIRFLGFFQAPRLFQPLSIRHQKTLYLFIYFSGIFFNLLWTLVFSVF